MRNKSETEDQVRTTSGTGDRVRTTAEPLVSRLVQQLSSVPVEGRNADRPVCRRCHDVGASSDDLFIEAGEAVYVRACWKEWTGWQLFGVYHAEHAESLRTHGTAPSRPAITFEGQIKKNVAEEVNEETAGRYFLTNLSLVDLVFPDDLSFSERVRSSGESGT
ncbi:MAG: hypothetical protein ABEJ05_02295 [Haloglomus sp.]